MWHYGVASDTEVNHGGLCECVCVCVRVGLCWRMTNVSMAIHPVVCAQANFTTAFPVLILLSHKFYIMQIMYSVKSWHILICSGGEPLSQGLIKHRWSIYDDTMYFGLRTCICLCDLADPQQLTESDRSHLPTVVSESCLFLCQSVFQTHFCSQTWERQFLNMFLHCTLGINLYDFINFY